MLNNPKMLQQARHESEPEFMSILKSLGFSNVRQSSRFEDFNHTDIFAESPSNKILCKFDVKDLTSNWLHSRNYCISDAFRKSISANPNNYVHHFIACREYINGKSTGRYLVFKTTDIFKNLVERTQKINKNAKFYTFNVDTCIKKCQYRVLSLGKNLKQI